MSSENKSNDESSQETLANDSNIILIVGVFLGLMSLVFIASAGSIGSSIDTFETVEQTNDLDEYATVVSDNNDTVTIEGVIVGENGGQKLTVKNVETVGGEMTVQVRTSDRDDYSATIQVLTGYKYKMVVSGIENIEKINVDHKGGEDFSLNMNNTNSMANKKEPTVSITEYNSSGGGLGEDNISVYENDNGEIMVDGLMSANTGGHKPVVRSVGTNNGTINVSFGLEAPNGIATQVISTYDYTAVIENVDGYDRIEVTQEGGESDTLKL